MQSWLENIMLTGWFTENQIPKEYTKPMCIIAIPFFLHRMYKMTYINNYTHPNNDTHTKHTRTRYYNVGCVRIWKIVKYIFSINIFPWRPFIFSNINSIRQISRRQADILTTATVNTFIRLCFRFKLNVIYYDYYDDNIISIRVLYTQRMQFTSYYNVILHKSGLGIFIRVLNFYLDLYLLIVTLTNICI